MTAERRLALAFLALLVGCGPMRVQMPDAAAPPGEPLRAARLMLELPPWGAADYGAPPRPAETFAPAYYEAARVLSTMAPDDVRAGLVASVEWTRRHHLRAWERLQQNVFVLNRLIFAIPADTPKTGRQMVFWKRIRPPREYIEQPVAWPVVVDSGGRVVGIESVRPPTGYFPVEDFDRLRARFGFRAPDDLPPGG